MLNSSKSKCNKATVAGLQRQNEELTPEIQKLRADFVRPQDSLADHETAADVHGGRTPDPETQKSLEYVSNEYDELSNSIKMLKRSSRA